MSISTLRHQEVFDAHANKAHEIHIVGAGAIGSRLFESLVNLGLTNIHIYDFDNVEPHNLANQVFGFSDIGVNKAHALSAWYRQKTGVLPPEIMSFNPFALPPPGTDTFKLNGTVFLAVDSMEQRRRIVETCIQPYNSVSMVIELRMSSSYGNIYSFNPQDETELKNWLGTLTNDDDAEVSLCGSSISVGATASTMANIAVWQFIHSRTDVNAMDKEINVFLKPFTVSTRSTIREAA